MHRNWYYGLSERRACHLIGITRLVARYKPSRPDDTDLRQRLRDVSWRPRGGRKRALGTRAPMALPKGPNQRWSLDFVSDAFGCGRRLRILCVVDRG